MADKLFFDRIFSRKGHVFEHAFDKDILDCILRCKNEGVVLDLGCGDGGLAIELAKRGFRVKCVDISKTAIGHVKEVSQRQGLDIKAEVVDLEDFGIDKDYDVIVCSAVLHFLECDDALELIRLMREHTREKGLNIISAFRKDDPNAKDDDSYFYASIGELKELYQDWKIEDYEEYDDYDPDEDETNKIAYIFAKKETT